MTNNSDQPVIQTSIGPYHSTSEHVGWPVISWCPTSAGIHLTRQMVCGHSW